MTYTQYETSEDDGDPLLTFEFTNAKLGTLYYTNASQPVTVGAQVYQPCPVKASSVKSTKDVQASELTLTFPRMHELPDAIRLPYSQPRTMLVVKRYHRKDLTDGIVYWRGRVVSVSTKNDSAEVSCENMQTMVKQLGNTQKYQTLCRHGLYSYMCGLSYEDWAVPGEVTEVLNSYTFRVDTAAAKADAYYKGGILNCNGELGFIVSHVGDKLTLLVPMQNPELGSSVSIAPGCSLTLSTCRDKFDNLLRHGGFPATPNKSPYGGTNVFSAS